MMRGVGYMFRRLMYDAGRAMIRRATKQRKPAKEQTTYAQYVAECCRLWPGREILSIDSLASTEPGALRLGEYMYREFVRGTKPVTATERIYSQHYMPRTRATRRAR